MACVCACPTYCVKKRDDKIVTNNESQIKNNKMLCTQGSGAA